MKRWLPKTGQKRMTSYEILLFEAATATARRHGGGEGRSGLLDLWRIERRS